MYKITPIRHMFTAVRDGVVTVLNSVSLSCLFLLVLGLLASSPSAQVSSCRLTRWTLIYRANTVLKHRSTELTTGLLFVRLCVLLIASKSPPDFWLYIWRCIASLVAVVGHVAFVGNTWLTFQWRISRESVADVWTFTSLKTLWGSSGVASS